MVGLQVDREFDFLISCTHPADEVIPCWVSSILSDAGFHKTLTSRAS